MKSEYKINKDIIEENVRILDVGCDDGTLMEFLKRNIGLYLTVLSVYLYLS